MKYPFDQMNRKKKMSMIIFLMIFDQMNRKLKKMSMIIFLMIFHHPLIDNDYFLTSCNGMIYVTVLLHRSVKYYTFSSVVSMLLLHTTVYPSV